MTGKPEAVQKHAAGWHEPDPVLRRAAISELWSDQAAYRNSGTGFRRHEGSANSGTEACEAFIRKAASSKWSKSAPTIRPSGTHGKDSPQGPRGHADRHPLRGIRREGRIVRDHQFVELLPKL
jgi:hypothetical protein